MPGRIVVVSDLHMAPPGDLDSFRAGFQLSDWIDSLHNGPTPVGQTTLVMNGDTFDFLQVDDRPRELDAGSVATLIERTLGTIKRTDWGQRLFPALARFVANGGTWIVIPGNHDPELHHPSAAELLARAVECSPEQVTIHADADPWTSRVGRFEVVIGHGNRADSFNHIDAAAWRRALREGATAPALPPGSRLVLDTVNAFKRAGYGFVDALKPEMPAVFLLLLYMDRKRALAHMPGGSKNAAHALARHIRHVIQRGPTLGVPERGVPSVHELVIQELLDSLDEDERLVASALLRRFEDWITYGDTPAAAAGSLAEHGGGVAAWLLRKALRRLSYDFTFFDPGALGRLDHAIIKHALPLGCGPRVVLAGHTHAARYQELDNDRVYINTGTWTDLMTLPDPPDPDDPDDADGDDLDTWIDDLKQGRLPRGQRLSFADITERGAELRALGHADDDPAQRRERT